MYTALNETWIWINNVLCFCLWVENNPNITGGLDVKNSSQGGKKFMLGRSEKSHITWWLVSVGSHIGTGLLPLSL